MNNERLIAAERQIQTLHNRVHAGTGGGLVDRPSHRPYNSQYPVLGRLAKLRLGCSQDISQNSDRLRRVTRARSIYMHLCKEITMATGSVKWFNPTKGYGFIQPQGGGKDVFVHISAVEKAGLSSLNEGQTVQYEIVSNRGKESAENLKVG